MCFSLLNVNLKRFTANCTLQACPHQLCLLSLLLFTARVYLLLLSMVCRQARDAQAQLAQSAAALDSAQVEVTQLKALAAERQKRFVMLNGTFKKKEDGLQERAEAAERQVADAQRECDAAQAQAASAIKVKQRIHIQPLEC